MNLHTEIPSHPEKSGGSETEYSRGKGKSDRIYPQKAKEFDNRVRDSKIKIGAAEIVRAQLEANPDVDALIQKIEQEIEALKKEPEINTTKLRLAQAKLERAKQIQSENKERGTALRLVRTKYESEWTPEALREQNPKREAEMSALSERAFDIYKKQIQREKQELQEAKDALKQAKKEKESFLEKSLRKNIRTLENQIETHQGLINLRQRMNDLTQEEQREVG
ncbi:hypothetical protein HYV70_01520 [Candidatus Uhrbacteria bacterium]|nr:hypothetical protein [Candidatus Uhrbacteria bacterium]